VLGTCALLITRAIALAATPLPGSSSALLWSTVDVCNTPAHPNTIGIRGSMPGAANVHELMYMQFRVEYRTAGGHWHFLVGGGSRFVLVGDGSSIARQAGQNFVIAAHAARTYVLRGVVTFQWRLHGRPIATLSRATRAGHSPAAGADPPGFSAASCRLQPKRRGSFVITPVTPSAARRPISARSSTVQA
jgi:hypothetical protein